MVTTDANELMRPLQLVGVRGDDGAALNVILIAMPPLPGPCKREGAAVPQRDVVGLLLAAGFLPLEESVRGDKAANLRRGPRGERLPVQRPQFHGRVPVRVVGMVWHPCCDRQ